MVERRKFKRYSMPRGTFAILRSKLDPLSNHARMSIGEIAMVLYKSKTEVMGQVTSMSFGGIAFDGNHSRVPNSEMVELDLLMTERGIYLHNIPFSALPLRSAGDQGRDTDSPHETILRFKKLDAKQKIQLEELLAHHIG